MGTGEGERPLEEGIRTDLRGAMSYSDYLDLPTLLSAQHPRSRPEHHDELLFIVAHQTSELWLKLVLHELRGARELLAADEVAQARKCLARVKHVLRTLADQWSVLATLTPHDYAQFRGALASASGFQSWQYRAVEFIRHMRTVQRTIGWRQGTGGSSGVAFLKRALELSFFPELITVRGELD